MKAISPPGTTWNQILWIIKYNKKDLSDILLNRKRTNNRSDILSGLVEKVEKIVGYTFTDKLLMIKALTHKSYIESNQAK